VAPKKKEVAGDATGVRWVWHGGIPFRSDDIIEGGLPGYVGLVRQDDFEFKTMTLKLETWPDYRIGSTAWPSGMLLARALAEGEAFLPDVKGKHIAELGAGPGLPALAAGKLGAATSVLTDRLELIPLMDRNIELNEVTGVCSAQALDWPIALQSPLSHVKRKAAGETPLDIVLAADVVYFEEQDPLMEALKALLAPEHTLLVLAYRERTKADRAYLDGRILPMLDYTRTDYTAEQGMTEVYIGRRRKDAEL